MQLFMIFSLTGETGAQLQSFSAKLFCLISTKFVSFLPEILAKRRMVNPIIVGSESSEQ